MYMEYIKYIESLLNNRLLTGSLVFLTITYGSIIAPKLSLRTANIISLPVTKILVIISIIMARKISPILAILISLCFIISMQSVNKQSIIQLTEKVIKINKNDRTSEVQTF